MNTGRIEFTSIDEDDERRRRDRRRGIRALVILAGLGLLAFAGREPEPVLRVAAGATDFGPQLVDTHASRSVSIRNTTREPFVVAGIVAEGTAIHDFGIDAQRCGRIDPDAECVATISFAPHDVGPQSATFRIVDGSNATSETIVIRGTGMPPAPPPQKDGAVIVPPPPPPQPPPPPPPPTPAPVPLPAPAPAPVPAPVPKPVHVPSPASVPPAAPVSKPSAPEPKSGDITVPMPPEEPAPSTTAPEVAPTAKPAEPEEPPKVEKPAVDPPPVEPAPSVTKPKDDSHKNDTVKKFLRVLAGVAAAGVIAKQAHDHGGDRHQADRRIEVTPRALTFQPAGKRSVYTAQTVTVTNVGKDDVTITSIQLASNAFRQQGECAGQKLAPRQQCRIGVSLIEPVNGAHATLVVNSDAGSTTVDVTMQQQQYTDGKP